MSVVDAHSHLYPRSYIELLKSRAELPRITGAPGGERFVIFPEEDVPGGGRPIDEEFWSVEAKLAFMDRLGIDRTVVSLGNPWLDPIDGPEGVDWARRLNTEFASLETATGGRIVGMGVLPATDPDAAADIVGEIAATDTLHGVITGCRPCGLELDDERLDPLWAALERSGSTLFVHPHYTAALAEIGGYGHALPVALGFPFETTIAITRLVLAGVLQRYPRLQVLAAHGGGTVPFLAARLDVGWRSEAAARTRLGVPPSGELAKVATDAVLYHARGLRATADLVGTDRMVFGTDHPFFRGDRETALEAVQGAFDAEAAASVLGANAARIYRLA